ncbi:MAG TPA: hypothetical protein VG291_06970 [Xanthobacteraceae bacterium]|jgi:hypothetical protein|nr:hypothetical protein [Xanthobacteraceae bacterium]
MQTILMFTVVVHVLSGTFWAGSTFVLARIGGAGAGQLARPQLGAAAFAVLTGAILWSLMHAHSFQPQELILASGACSAIIAVGIQGASAARMKLAHANAISSPALGSVAVNQRIAAALLAVTVICMASARYV